MNRAETVKTEYSLDDYFSGREIYGNDFNAEQIEEWYKDEQEGYANLGAKDSGTYRYGYHALNKLFGFESLGEREFEHALGIGSAYGHEFEPIAERIRRISIIDSSRHFEVSHIKGTPVDYQRADPAGDLPLADGSVDLVTCFGVLHHIPNVSKVVGEMARCLKQEGLLLLREPIVSMGDWRTRRNGLTKRERGLPLGPFTRVIEEAGFRSVNLVLFGFSPLVKLMQTVSAQPYNNRHFVHIDRVLSRLFLWNYTYHRTSIFSKFSPSAGYWVLEKI